ncbi:MAG: hypothetical protein IPH88_05910 [Bacteroidales bacterium]|nr:hypothetical protein [Bacteroidales bacterium]
MNDAGREKLRNSKPYTASETNTIDAPDFDSGLKLLTENGSVYLEINLSSDWCTAQKRRIITSSILGKAIVPGLPFENPDGSAIVLDKDYWGKQRNESNPSPGPFEISKSGKQKIKVW